MLPKIILTPQKALKLGAKGDMVLRGIAPPREDHTYQRCRCKMCAPYLRWLRRCSSSSKVLLKMEDRGVLQDLIPDVGQLELACVPIKGWIIGPNVHILLCGPGNNVCLHTHYEKIVNNDVMT